MVKIAQQKLKKPNEWKVKENEKDLVRILQPVGVFKLVRIQNSFHNVVQGARQVEKLVVACHISCIKGPLGQCYHPTIFVIMRN